MSAQDSNTYTITHEPDGKRIGTSTIGAGFGGVLGFEVGRAIADIVVHAAPGVGPVEESIAYLINVAIFVAGVLLGGKFTPTNQKKVETQVVAAPDVVDQVVPPFPGTELDAGGVSVTPTDQVTPPRV